LRYVSGHGIEKTRFSYPDALFNAESAREQILERGNTHGEIFIAIRNLLLEDEVLDERKDLSGLPTLRNAGSAGTTKRCTWKSCAVMMQNWADYLEKT
jgi:hypothetical protein